MLSINFCQLSHNAVRIFMIPATTTTTQRQTENDAWKIFLIRTSERISIFDNHIILVTCEVMRISIRWQKFMYMHSFHSRIRFFSLRRLCSLSSLAFLSSTQFALLISFIFQSNSIFGSFFVGLFFSPSFFRRVCAFSLEKDGTMMMVVVVMVVPISYFHSHFSPWFARETFFNKSMHINTFWFVWLLIWMRNSKRRQFPSKSVNK